MYQNTPNLHFLMPGCLSTPLQRDASKSIEVVLLLDADEVLLPHRLAQLEPRLRRLDGFGYRVLLATRKVDGLVLVWDLGRKRVEVSRRNGGVFARLGLFESQSALFLGFC